MPQLKLSVYLVELNPITFVLPGFEPSTFIMGSESSRIVKRYMYLKPQGSGSHLSPHYVLYCKQVISVRLMTTLCRIQYFQFNFTLFLLSSKLLIRIKATIYQLLLHIPYHTILLVLYMSAVKTQTQPSLLECTPLQQLSTSVKPVWNYNHY